MNVLPTELPEVRVVEPRVFADARGYFLETWQEDRYARAGLGGPLVQDNLSWSGRGVLRGLHYQHPCPQAKLVQVLSGEIVDVAVDIRRGSPTFARWVAVTLSSENRRQLWVPEGFAHGFQVVSESALVAYKCSVPYTAEYDAAIAWNDPDLAIAWPLSPTPPLLSPKDATAPLLRDVPLERLPAWTPAARLAA